MRRLDVRKTSTSNIWNKPRSFSDSLGFTPVTEIDYKDFATPLSQVHRDAMIDLILAWATLDNTLGILLAYAKSIDHLEAASQFGKIPALQKSRKLSKALRLIGRKRSEKCVLKQEVHCRRFSEARNLIAHAKCVGFNRSDPSYLIFAKFEVFEGGLSAVALSLDEISLATKWARRVDKFMMNAIRRIDPSWPTH